MPSATRFSAKPPWRSSCPPSVSGCTRGSRISSKRRSCRPSTPETSVIADFALHAYEAHDQPRALEGSVHALRAFVAAAAYREALTHAERALELWPRVDDAAARVGMDHPDLLILASRSASRDEAA